MTDIFNIRLNDAWDNNDELLDEQLRYEDEAYRRDRLAGLDAESDSGSDIVCLITYIVNVLSIY